MQPDFDNRRPVSALSADELFAELVEDAVLLRVTPIKRFVEACEKIGKARKIGADAAFEQIVSEKAALTGNRLMPLG